MIDFMQIAQDSLAALLKLAAMMGHLLTIFRKGEQKFLV